MLRRDAGVPLRLPHGQQEVAIQRVGSFRLSEAQPALEDLTGNAGGLRRRLRKGAGTDQAADHLLDLACQHKTGIIHGRPPAKGQTRLSWKWWRCEGEISYPPFKYTLVHLERQDYFHPDVRPLALRAGP